MGLDRPAAAEFSFFLAMPTLPAAFGHDLWKVRHDLAPERAGEIAVGLAMAFVASLLVVKAVSAVCRAIRIWAVRLVSHHRRASRCSPHLSRAWSRCGEMQWLRRNFVAGFFVTVPLVVSIVTIYGDVSLGRRTHDLGSASASSGVHVPSLGLLATAAQSCWWLASSRETSSGAGSFSAARMNAPPGPAPSGRSTRRSTNRLPVLARQRSPGFKRVVLVDDLAGQVLLSTFLAKEIHLESEGAGTERHFSLSTCRPTISTSAKSSPLLPKG